MSCSVSGNVKNVLGVNAVGGRVSFKLINFGALAQITGTNIVAPQEVSCTIGADGSFHITLDGNDQITPANSLYAVSFNVQLPNANGYDFNVNQNYGPIKYSITGSTFDLNTATPVGTPSNPVFTNQPVLLNPSGSQLITQPSNTTFSVTGGGVGIEGPFGLKLNDISGASWLVTTSNSSLNFENDSNTTVMTIGNTGSAFSGYVGIGTTSPAHKLDVNGDFNAASAINTQQSAGDVFIASAASIAQKAMRLQNTGCLLFVGIDGNAGQGFGFPYESVWFSNANNSHFVTPLATFTGDLDVDGTVSTEGDLFLSRQSNSTGYLTRPNVSGFKNLAFACAGASTLDSISAITTVFNVTGTYQQNGTNGVSVGPLTSISSITTAGGIVTALSGTSDERLKNVLHPFTRGLEDVLKITPQVYTWNEDGQKRTGFKAEQEFAGFIAQDVQKAIPEAIEGTEGDEKYLTLGDKPLIAALINAVKELAAKNIELEDRLAKLEAKV